MTIPSDLLKLLNLGTGDTVSMEVIHGDLVAHPHQKKALKRYTLKELLKGTNTKVMKALNKETAWAREGKPVGREKA